LEYSSITKSGVKSNPVGLALALLEAGLRLGQGFSGLSEHSHLALMILAPSFSYGFLWAGITSAYAELK